VVQFQFANPAAYDVALGLLDPMAADVRLRTIEFATDGSAAELYSSLGRLADAGAPALTVSIHRPSLDDVFFSLTGAHAHDESLEVSP
jgi:ABC-2 type transport system ATP-binding protein